MRVNWLLWISVLFAGILLGALGVGVVWFTRDNEDQKGRVVDAGSFDELVNTGGFPPVLFARDGFYLVMAVTGELKALYLYPPISQVRERPDCAVTWQEHGVSEGVFRDPCSGATFSRDGVWLSGPSSRGLDQFPVEVKDGRVLVDTRQLVCDGPGDCRVL